MLIMLEALMTEDHSEATVCFLEQTLSLGVQKSKSLLQCLQRKRNTKV
jgi:hypothetical protein